MTGDHPRRDPHRVRPGSGVSPAAVDDDVCPAARKPHPSMANELGVQLRSEPESLRHPGGGEELKPAPRLPIPVLAEVSWGAEVDVSAGADTRHVVTSVDRDGRLADRSVTAFMGWSAGQAVEWAVEPNLIVIARSGVGGRINRRGHLRLPLTVRRACRIAARDRVLVAGDQRRGELLVIPTTVLTYLIDAYRQSPDSGRQP
jgi:hypothetical protein